MHILLLIQMSRCGPFYPRLSKNQTFTEYPIPPMIMKNQSNRRQRLNFLLLTYPQPAGAAFATYVSKLRIDIFVS